jgi:hypothetical protein
MTMSFSREGRSRVACSVRPIWSAGVREVAGSAREGLLVLVVAAV